MWSCPPCHAQQQASGKLASVLSYLENKQSSGDFNEGIGGSKRAGAIKWIRVAVTVQKMLIGLPMSSAELRKAKKKPLTS